jgi:hypothetical protein
MSHDAIHSELAAFDARSRQATQAGAEAFGRQLEMAEDEESGQTRRIAQSWPPPTTATPSRHAHLSMTGIRRRPVLCEVKRRDGRTLPRYDEDSRFA